MPDNSLWDAIAVPRSDFNVRRVDCNAAVPVYWGRDTDGGCLFIIELEGDHTTEYRRNAVAAKGIGVDLRSGDQGRQHLVLKLERHVNRDLFDGLCRTLASNLGQATDSAIALAITLAHIRRWKSFLAGRAQTMSAEEVRGLFAELAFLLELAERTSFGIAAVEAWLGPDRSHQDFLIANSAVEIKAVTGRERNAIRMSSEDQLEALCDRLFLRMYRLSSMPDADGARSLNEIVGECQERFADTDGAEPLDQKLLAYGYVPLPDYDNPRFVISEVRSFRVGNDFPRLVRSGLPAGIMRVGYDIALEAITPFACDQSAVFESL